MKQNAIQHDHQKSHLQWLLRHLIDHCNPPLTCLDTQVYILSIGPTDVILYTSKEGVDKALR